LLAGVPCDACGQNAIVRTGHSQARHGRGPAGV